VDWQVQTTSVKGRCPAGRVLDPDGYYELGTKVSESIASSPPINVIPMDDLATPSRFAPLDRLGRTWQGCCSGGKLNLFVRADGSVTPCSALAFEPFVVGRLAADGSGLEALCRERRCEAALRSFNDPGTLEGACRRCPHAARCRGGCPEIQVTMCGGRRENRYCFWPVEETRLRRDLEGIW
jgi:radical SAM protein with 4Fe4S-binding SPASM domain